MYNKESQVLLNIIIAVSSNTDRSKEYAEYCVEDYVHVKNKILLFKCTTMFTIITHWT